MCKSTSMLLPGSLLSCMDKSPPSPPPSWLWCSYASAKRSPCPRVRLLSPHLHSIEQCGPSVSQAETCACPSWAAELDVPLKLWEAPIYKSLFLSWEVICPTRKSHPWEMVLKGFGRWAIICVSLTKHDHKKQIKQNANLPLPRAVWWGFWSEGKKMQNTELSSIDISVYSLQLHVHQV